MLKKLLLVTIIFIFIIAAAFGVFYYQVRQNRLRNIPNLKSNESLNLTKTDVQKIEIIAQNLEVPWAIAHFANGSMLVTERAGRVRLIDQAGRLDADPILQINVRQLAESGLHGVAIHPSFSSKPYVYFYYTYSAEGDNTENRVVRYKFDDKKFSDEKIIVDAIPGARFHDGGRLTFGPDKFLYITTGDALNPSLAQDTNSKAGKILRVADDGQIPGDNPFQNEVYSYGHRNPQGITWDSEGRLWETEHGNNATDEVNLIEKGKNYGWPDVRGNETKDGMQNPVIQSGQITWAPAGLAYLNGSLFFGGLRGQTLFEAKIEGDKLALKEHFKGELGRIRAVVTGPDNFLYISTSNRDGRGIPLDGDDKILRINPGKL